MSDWKLKGFKKSNTKNKKYDAIIQDKEGHERKISFGHTQYQQYKDTTGLNIYSNKDHLDKNRRRLYHIRHNKDIKPNQYSAGYFSMKYLW